MQILDDLYFYPWESYTENNANSVMITGPSKVLIDPGTSTSSTNWPRIWKRTASLPTRSTFASSLTATRITWKRAKNCSPGRQTALHPDDENTWPRSARPSTRHGAAYARHQHRREPVEGELSWATRPSKSTTRPALPRRGLPVLARAKVLIAGDLIFAQGVGRTDFPAAAGSYSSRASNAWPHWT